MEKREEKKSWGGVGGEAEETSVLIYQFSNSIVLFWCISQLRFLFSYKVYWTSWWIRPVAVEWLTAAKKCVSVLLFLKIRFCLRQNKNKIVCKKDAPEGVQGNNANCSGQTEVMPHMVYVAASCNVRGAKPRKLNCCIYKMHRVFLQIWFIPFMWRGNTLPSWKRQTNVHLE